MGYSARARLTTVAATMVLSLVAVATAPAAGDASHSSRMSRDGGDPRPAGLLDDDQEPPGVVEGRLTGTDPDAGPPADPDAPTTIAGYGASTKLAVWNHDLQDGRNSVIPAFWSGTRSTSLNKAVKVPGPRPFPTYTGAGERNAALWVKDYSSSRPTLLRSKALTARPGSLYGAQGYTMTGRGTPARLYLEFLDRRGRRIKLSQQYNASVTSPMRPRWARVLATAPARTTTVRVVVASSIRTSGSSYWTKFFVTARDRVGTVPYRPRLSKQSVLFVGNGRLQSYTGLSKVVQAPKKHGSSPSGIGSQPVYSGFNAAQGGAAKHHSQMFGNVLKTADGYEMYFTARTMSGPWSVRRAVSDDGINWSAGTVVLPGVWCGGVVLNPDRRDPSKRYLMLGVSGTMDMKITRLPMPKVNVFYQAYASPDGKTWRLMQKAPVLPFRDIASVSYDPFTKKFFAATKQASGVNRQVYLSTSSDFLHWTTPRRTFHSDHLDPKRTDAYSAATFRYGDQLLALPVMYTQSLVRGVDGPLVPYIASSVDGVTFQRPADRRPTVPLSPAPYLDRGMILTSSEMLTDGDTVRLYYGAWSAGHETPKRYARIYLAEWKRDRFVALRVSGRPSGVVVTRPLQLTGAKLFVNAAPATGGTLRAEVLDARSGRVIPGYAAAQSSPVTSDTLESQITWGGKDLSSFRNRQVKLRFILTKGDFYSFRVS